jgi:hypothetical protein
MPLRQELFRRPLGRYFNSPPTVLAGPETTPPTDLVTPPTVLVAPETNPPVACVTPPRVLPVPDTVLFSAPPNEFDVAESALLVVPKVLLAKPEGDIPL